VSEETLSLSDQFKTGRDVTDVRVYIIVNKQINKQRSLHEQLKCRAELLYDQ
jgi:hypothetical protein